MVLGRHSRSAMWRVLPVAVAATAGALLAGCSSDSGSSGTTAAPPLTAAPSDPAQNDKAQVVAAISGLLAAYADGDLPGVLDHTCGVARSDFANVTPEQLRQEAAALPNKDAYYHPQISDVKALAGNATAMVRLDPQQLNQFVLMKTNGTWRVCGIDEETHAPPLTSPSASSSGL